MSFCIVISNASAAVILQPEVQAHDPGPSVLKPRWSVPSRSSMVKEGVPCTSVGSDHVSYVNGRM